MVPNSTKTELLVVEYQNAGYTIVVGNNPHLDKRRKYKYHRCVRLCRTNSRRHGWCIKTVWAIKPIMRVVQ